MVNNYVIAVVAFLVLACLLACMLAQSHARRKDLPLGGGFQVENTRPGRRPFRIGGEHDAAPTTEYSATPYSYAGMPSNGSQYSDMDTNINCTASAILLKSPP
jgi:hypothetical protein